MRANGCNQWLTVQWWPAPITTHPHLLVRSTSEQWVPTMGATKWLSLVKSFLKVALDGMSCLLLACTSKCGWARTTKTNGKSNKMSVKTFELASKNYLRATSQMSQEPWPCHGEDPWLSSKGRTMGVGKAVLGSHKPSNIVKWEWTMLPDHCIFCWRKKKEGFGLV